jgi:hypothetical protein
VFLKIVPSIVCLALAYWFFVRKSTMKDVGLFGLVCFCAGALSQTVVMVANNGYMPCAEDIFAAFYPNYPCYISGGNLLAMGDVIHPIGASIGDAFMAFGGSILLAALFTCNVSQPVFKWINSKKDDSIKRKV